MASDDKKTKAILAPKSETAVKKAVAEKKKDEVQPKDKSPSDVDLTKAEAARRLPTHPRPIVGARGKSRFRKLIRITGTQFMEKRRNDSWLIGASRPSI